MVMTCKKKRKRGGGTTTPRSSTPRASFSMSGRLTFDTTDQRSTRAAFKANSRIRRLELKPINRKNRGDGEKSGDGGHVPLLASHLARKKTQKITSVCSRVLRSRAHHSPIARSSRAPGRAFLRDRSREPAGVFRVTPRVRRHGGRGPRFRDRGGGNQTRERLPSWRESLSRHRACVSFLASCVANQPKSLLDRPRCFHGGVPGHRSRREQPRLKCRSRGAGWVHHARLAW